MISRKVGIKDIYERKVGSRISRKEGYGQGYLGRKVMINIDTFSRHAENLLNRGLNFAITSLSLNLSQVLVDCSFERRLLWREFFCYSGRRP